MALHRRLLIKKRRLLRDRSAKKPNHLGLLSKRKKVAAAGRKNKLPKTPNVF